MTSQAMSLTRALHRKVREAVERRLRKGEEERAAFRAVMTALRQESRPVFLAYMAWLEAYAQGDDSPAGGSM